MPDGNFLSAFGLDPQLLTAGAGGGLVKALIGKQKVLDAMASMTVGAMTANYVGAPFASLLGSVELFGLRMNLRPEVGAFFAGIFAFWIVERIGNLLRKKFGDEGSQP